MTCQEVVFAKGTCHLNIEERTTDPAMPLFLVQMQLVDTEHSIGHDLVLENGRHAEVHAPTEALAISSAIAFLQQEFGGLTEYAHGCPAINTPRATGEPVVVAVPWRVVHEG